MRQRHDLRLKKPQTGLFKYSDNPLEPIFSVNLPIKSEGPHISGNHMTLTRPVVVRRQHEYAARSEETSDFASEAVQWDAMLNDRKASDGREKLIREVCVGEVRNPIVHAVPVREPPAEGVKVAAVDLAVAQGVEDIDDLRVVAPHVKHWG